MPRWTPMCDDKKCKEKYRDTQIGHPDYNEYVPMFFNKYRNPLSLEGRYCGASAFLVSNGTSLSTLDLNLLKRPGVMMLSMNNGASTLFKYGITPQLWTCVDDAGRFIKQIWLNPAITKFVPFSFFDKDAYLWDNDNWCELKSKSGNKESSITVADCPNVIGYMRNNKFAGHRYFTESSFN